MNSYMTSRWPWIDGSHAMRASLTGLLRDEDLAFTPGGDAPALGVICRDMGRVQRAYLRSLDTFSIDFAAEGDERRGTTVSDLQEWYAHMEQQMKERLEGLREADFERPVERGGGFALPLQLHLDVYLQALLIFFGKVSVYFTVMRRPLPAQFAEYIG